MHPSAVVPVRIGTTVVENSLVSAVNLYIIVYFLFMFIGAALLCMMGVDFMDDRSLLSCGSFGGKTAASLSSLGYLRRLSQCRRVVFKSNVKREPSGSLLL